MIQLGAIFSGFSLYALFTWLPIWGLAKANSPEALFAYFLIISLLLFGIFLTSGGRNSFSFFRFAPSFVAGALVSMGYATTAWALMASGLVIFSLFWFLLGE